MKWCSCIVFFITCTKCPPSSVPFWAEWKGVPLLKLAHYTPSAVWKPFKVSEADEVREQNHSFHSIFFFFSSGPRLICCISSALWFISPLVMVCKNLFSTCIFVFSLIIYHGHLCTFPEQLQVKCSASLCLSCVTILFETQSQVSNVSPPASELKVDSCLSSRGIYFQN